MSEDNRVECVLTPAMSETIKEAFNLEVKMLQGEQTKLADGRTKYVFYVNDEKGYLLKEFLLKLISQSHNKILN